MTLESQYFGMMSLELRWNCGPLEGEHASVGDRRTT